MQKTRQQHSVMLLPSDVHGLDGNVRVGSGAEPEALREGMNRFGAYLREEGGSQDRLSAQQPSLAT